MPLPNRILFGWPIYSDIGPLYSPSLSDGAWSTALPIENVQSRDMSLAARSLDAALTSTRTRVDLKADRLIRALAVPRHTISQGGKARFLIQSSDLLFDYEAGDDIVARGGTFSRTGEARYVDSGGVVRVAATGVPRDGHFENGIRTLLMEADRVNICLQSQAFNTTWGVTNASIVANADTAPDGTLTADRLVEDSTPATTHHTNQTPITITANANVALSVYGKAGGRQWVAFQFSDTTNTDAVTVYFNLATGAIGTISGAGTAVSIKALVEPHADDWYRCKMTVNIGNGRTSCVVRIFLAEADNDANFSGNGVGYVSLWGAQIEDNRAFPSSYIPTTTGSATRNADSLTFPCALTGLTAADDDFTLYTKVSRPVWADVTVAIGARSVGGIGSSTAKPFLYAEYADASPHDPYAVVAEADGGFPNSGSRPKGAGNTLELCAQWEGLSTGAGVSRLDANSGAGFGTNSAAIDAMASFGAQEVRIGGFSSTVAIFFGGIQSFRVYRGLKTLAEMQTTVHDSGWLEAWPPVYPAGSLPSDDPRLVDGYYTAEEAIGRNMGLTYVPGAGFTGRYVSLQIDNSLNPAGYVDVGRLVITGGWQPTINASYGLKRGWEDDSVRQISDGGAAIHNPKAKRRTVAGVIHELPDDEAMTTPFEMQRRLGLSQQVLWVLDPNDTHHMHRNSFLGTLRELSSLELVVGPRDGLPFAVVEEL